MEILAGTPELAKYWRKEDSGDLRLPGVSPNRNARALLASRGLNLGRARAAHILTTKRAKHYYSPTRLVCIDCRDSERGLSYKR
jgi:hypothetical protein